VARQLAARLGYLYLDTGALYRAVAWKVHAGGIKPDDADAVVAVLSETRLEMEPSPGAYRVTVDGRDITGELRTDEISRLASIVSAIPGVREWLLPVQRRLGAVGGVVAEGRDIGTRIFPAADVKFFLEANPAVRAERRHRELVAAGESAALERTRAEMEHRDERDRTRTVAPLARAADAMVIDTSALDVEQVLERMLKEIGAKT